MAGATTTAHHFAGKQWTQGLDGTWQEIAHNPWDSDGEWYTPTEKEEDKYCYRPSQCVCSSRELFANGCTCGFIVKKSWDEKLREIEKKKREEQQW